MTTGRIRRVRGVVTPVAVDKKAMKENLKSIAKMQETIDQLQLNIKPLFAKLEEDMIKSQTLSLEVDGTSAEIVKSAGKAQVTVDPHKFYDKVSEEDFFASITVGVTKAKVVLSQKELDKISTKVDGKAGPAKLVISRK